jgi:hypothetical protein
MHWQGLNVYSLSKENKMNILNAFVLSNFNYCPMVWTIVALKTQEKYKNCKNGAYALCTMIQFPLMKHYLEKRESLSCILAG